MAFPFVEVQTGLAINHSFVRFMPTATRVDAFQSSHRIITRVLAIAVTILSYCCCQKAVQTWNQSDCSNLFAVLTGFVTSSYSYCDSISQHFER